MVSSFQNLIDVKTVPSLSLNRNTEPVMKHIVMVMKHLTVATSVSMNYT